MHGLLAALLIALFAARPALATEPSGGNAALRAQEVAKVVLGILSYARWPAEPTPLRLCLVGPTEYADALIQGVTPPTGKPLQITRLLANDPGIASRCDAAYIGTLTANERSSVFAQLANHPVLTISEADDPCTVGSLFCLRVTDQQVAFEVNLDSVARSGVRIHPSVLQLSRRRAVQP